MFGWIGNVRVGAKLGLGFGAVLVAALLLVAAGWHALDTLIDRGIKVKEITQVSDDTRDLRIQRLRLGSNRQAESLQSLQQILDRMAEHLANLKGSLASAYDLELVERQIKSAEHYQRILRKLSIPDANVGPLYEQMAQLGDDLLNTAQKLIESQDAKRNADANSAKALLSFVAAIAFLMGALIAWIIYQQIVTPLRQTLKVMEALAKGDLNQDLVVERRDELGQLQSGLKQLILSLRELIGGIHTGVVQVASAAEQLSAVTEQTSAGVNNQKSETDRVATAMHEMAATVQDVARNAEEAAQAAATTDQHARAGEKVVANAIVQIQHLALEVDHSADAVGKLKEQSDKIGGVLDVIKAVAQQTNLLALNAAIEAARAGEAGRGFAVVADEVRNLALRTQQSTEEIESLVVGIQTSTNTVFLSMESSLEMSKTSVEFTRSAVSSLEDITRSVSTIQLMNQQIAAASEQQSAVAEEINRSVINVRDISDQTAEASEETAASSVELARLGHELEGLVTRFKM